MKERKLILTFLIIFQITQSFAQQYYQPLKSYGQIPDKIVEQVNLNSLKNKLNPGKDISKRERKNLENFSVLANFSTDYLYRSGRIFINNELQQYLTDIKNYVLRNHPELQKEVNIYLFNKTGFNANILSNGDILIQTELLSKIDNEAQLAFIICHELTHYVKKHHVKGYKKQIEVKGNEQNYKRLSYDEKLLVLSTYSQQQEKEADSLGFFQFYINTNYDLTEAADIFRNNFYSNLPLKNSNFDLAYFENEIFPLPQEYKLFQVDSLLKFEYQEDSLSSHPDLKTRQQYMLSNIKDLDNKGKLKFIISEEKFNQVKMKAQFELLYLHIQNQQYEEAVVNSMSLLNDNPDASFLKLNIALSMLEISIYKSRRDYYTIAKDIKQIQGDGQRVLHLFDQIDKERMAVLAFGYLWNLRADYKNDKQYESILQVAVDNLFDNFDMLMDDMPFIDKEISNDEAHLNYLASINNDPEFRKFLSVSIDKTKKKREEVESLLNDPEKRRKILNEKKYIQKHGFSLGIDKIVVVNPIGFSVNLKEEMDTKDFELSNFYRKILIEYLYSNANKLELDIDLLDLSNLQTDDIEEYNDYCKASDWFSEKCSHPLEDYFMVNSIYINDLISKYGTRYFAWTGLINLENERILSSDRFILDLYLFDIKTGEIILSQREWFANLNNVNQVDKKVYTILNQIKRTPN